jgi:hypothetical protein
MADQTNQPTESKLSEVLDWMGEHPILTGFILIVGGSIVYDLVRLIVGR